jgi:hypothetical protein
MTTITPDELDMFTDREDDLRLTNVHGLTAFLSTDGSGPHQLTVDEYLALPRLERFEHDEARLDYLSDSMTVYTPQLVEARNLITLFIRNNRRRRGKQRPGIILSGDGTSGKTTTCHEMMRVVHQSYESRFPRMREEERRPVVYVEVPSACNTKLFWLELSNFFGRDPLPKETQGQVRSAVLEALALARTELIVIDEVQNLSGTDVATRGALKALRQLTSDFLGVVVVAGVNLQHDKLFDGPEGRQLSGRMTEIDLEPFGIATPQMRKEWRGLISAFERKMPLLGERDGKLSEHWEALHTFTAGRIATLAKIFASSATALIYAGDPAAETITIELLLAQPRDRASVEEDNSSTPLAPGRRR